MGGAQFAWPISHAATVYKLEACLSSFSEQESEEATGTSSSLQMLCSAKPKACLLSLGDVQCLLQVGMRHFNIRKNQYFCPIINLDKLWSLVGEEVRRMSTAIRGLLVAIALFASSYGL